ncbi:hypothetical protein QVD17_41564 [Tagetes erecta]|uniref:Uncharacterized protein n=1 Tax=Tagetes erecta TaxID=13708 RepID=A0AAD8JPH5_TARER|nr:hypothetical protein QVD17_41564 [Tagetes erecta]
MFDREARYILKTTASELLLNNDQYIGDDIIPKCFDSFMDQKFAFKIKIKDFNIENKKAEFYTISKLSDDPSVISLHDKKFAAEQPEDQSFDLPMTDFGSQSSPSIKDCVSCTGESGTPSSFDGHVDGNKTSIVDTSTTFVSSIVGVKRNLEKVYDVDDMFTTCSNKSRGSDKQDEDNENSKQKLLIPKIEK